MNLAEPISRISARCMQATGSLFSKLGGIANFTVYLTLAMGIGATCIYKNPVNASKVLFAELTGSKAAKHVHVEQAKYDYARRENLKFLDNNHLRSLGYEMGVVPSGTNTFSDEDIGWDRLFDFLSKNNKYGRDSVRTNYTEADIPAIISVPTNSTPTNVPSPLEQKTVFYIIK